MYTSEIREADHEGKPVTVSPSLLTRVRETDEALRNRLQDESQLEFTGRWVFPAPEQAVLSLTVVAPNLPESFSVSLPLVPQSPERFSSRAVQSVLRYAGEVVHERFKRRLHKLLTWTGESE